MTNNGTAPRALGVGDFNQDGRSDLAVADAATNEVDILLGNGRGGFTPAPGSPLKTGVKPVAIVVADFNGDGKFDLATANLGDDSFDVQSTMTGTSLNIFLGDGTGAFSTAQGSPLQLDGNLELITSGDLNGDGHADLIVANNARTTQPASVVVLLGDGTGQFSSGDDGLWLTEFPGDGVASLNTGDFNGDGFLDVAALVYGKGVAMLFGDGTGSLSGAALSGQGPGFVPVAGGPLLLAVEHFTSSQALDLATVASVDYPPFFSVFLGDGKGSFAGAPSSSVPANDTIYGVSTADFNGDGLMDIAMAGEVGGVHLLRGNGRGGFADAPGSPFVVRTLPNPAYGAIAVSDFNGDGRPDVAVTYDEGPGTTPSVVVLLNQCR